MNHPKTSNVIDLNKSDLARLNGFFGQGTFSDKLDTNPLSISSPLYSVHPDNLNPFPNLNMAVEYLQLTFLQFQQAQLELAKSKNNGEILKEIEKQVQKMHCSNATELFKKYADNNGTVNELFAEYKEIQRNNSPETKMVYEKYDEFSSAYNDYRTHFLDEYAVCSFDEQHKIDIVEKHNDFVRRIDSDAEKFLGSSALISGGTKNQEFVVDHFKILSDSKTKEFNDFVNPTIHPHSDKSKDFDL